MTTYTGTQLATILSALDGQTRKPASKSVALTAIRRHADELGCTVENILEAAAGLLDGRMSAEAFRAALHDRGATDEPGDDAATNVAEADEGAAVAATVGVDGRNGRDRAGACCGPHQRPARQRRSDRHRQRRFLADADDAQAAAARCMRGRRALAAGRTRPARARPGPTTSCAPCVPPSSGLRRSRAGRASSRTSRRRRAPTPSRPA